MIKYSKFTDIHAVLNKVNLLIGKIEEEYEKSLTLGNLRSALDYLIAKVSKHNFPICKTEKEFENATADLSEVLPKLALLMLVY